MNFYRSKTFLAVITPIGFLLLLAAAYGVKRITSVYKTDFGNGVVIYADNYVKTGRWVFDCNYSRLVSREPLPTPLAELENVETFAIGHMYHLNDADEVLSKQAIKAVTALPDWLKALRYLYSGLDEYSDLRSHNFYMLAEHDGRKWALEVDQRIGYDGQSTFRIIAKPYDRETYVDYAKALQIATDSCPVPQ
ncbi:hypothetical protein SJI00_18665 [Pseudomonas sp. RP23018S]|uniref:hypothetical protein n=1 Tax=Pseudomonas sp. RP23018S TaxID=3096037 RepID=UPI002ACA3551|nr:hypothetical protein [Pseudomonas sp. RP23018S]MDZ5604795.1 hypothetical protein [Pseudomonas sp. RP23018S]